MVGVGRISGRGGRASSAGRPIVISSGEGRGSGVAVSVGVGNDVLVMVGIGVKVANVRLSSKKSISSGTEVTWARRIGNAVAVAVTTRWAASSVSTCGRQAAKSPTRNPAASSKPWVVRLVLSMSLSRQGQAPRSRSVACCPSNYCRRSPTGRWQHLWSTRRGSASIVLGFCSGSSASSPPRREIISNRHGRSQPTTIILILKIGRRLIFHHLSHLLYC